MVGIALAAGTCRISNRFGIVAMRQKKSHLERFYSTEKNNNIQEKKTILQRLEEGFRFGKWKFYAQELVFKNLQPDSVPSAYKMCYRSDLETYANFAILTASATTVALPTLLSYQIFMDAAVADIHELAAFVTAAVAFTIALYTISMRVPMRIYYSAKCDDFLVYFPRLVPYTTRKMQILPGHVIPPTSSSIYLPWIDIQHIHTQTKQKMLINGDKFILPMYYNKLMGY